MNMPDQPHVQAVHADKVNPGDAPQRIAWSATSDDLHVNLIALGQGEAIAEHVNAQLDVLQTCIAGTGVLIVDGEELPFHPGNVVLVPKGARRGTQAGDGGLRYVTCHGRRPGLMPVVNRGGERA